MGRQFTTICRDEVYYRLFMMDVSAVYKHRIKKLPKIPGFERKMEERGRQEKEF